MFHDNGDTSFWYIPAGAIDSSELLVWIEGSRPELEPISKDLSYFFWSNWLLFNGEDRKGGCVEHFFQNAWILIAR